MPVVNYHLVAGRDAPDAVGELLRRSCALFAEVLDSPIERVRAFATLHEPSQACVGGRLVADGAEPAPFFQFALLAGRPLDHRHRLLAGFTDLLVEVLGTPRELIRGGIWLIDPEDWAIGGVPAAALRRAEIEARRITP
ncbi:MAG: tautomerase family protein [Kineosporiaceae bacterium]|nr:tautomerase family protein [Kineosporiaceae bacterium]